MEFTLFQRVKMNNLLEIKMRLKKVKPDFIRSDAHKKKRLGENWRFPKGHHNKMRLGKAGHRKLVEVGYRMPRAVRGVESSGLKKVIIHNLKELEKIDAKKECALIANIGLKKKIEIVKEALKKKIVIFGMKDPSLFLKQAEEDLNLRKEKKKMAEVKKKEREKKKEIVPKEKKEEKNLTPEEKEEQERREKEKIITKKQ